MKHPSRKHLFSYGFCLSLLFSFQGCIPKEKKEGIKWQPTLSEKGTNPYDCSIAWASLPYYFPNARLQQLNQDFRYNHMGAGMWATQEDSTTLLLLAGLDFFIGKEEWEALKAYIREGHEVMLFCSRLDNLVTSDLNLIQYGGMEAQPLSKYYDGKSNLKLLQLKEEPALFGYQGRSLEGYFQLNAVNEQDSDTAIFGKPQILGTRHTAEALPNLIRYQIGRGHLTLHAAPLVLSNYFLLQDHNRSYLDGLMHTLPANISKVYWQSYHHRQREGHEWSVLWRNPATRWAIILAIATLLLYVLFEMKRRQRIIPEIPKPENTSVQFATTIGQLYYHQGNHRNLAFKMWQHFQDWLRTTHNLETPPEPDETFARRLQGKTGQSEADVKRLLYLVHILHQESHYYGEKELTGFYNAVRKFYEGSLNS